MYSDSRSTTVHHHDVVASTLFQGKWRLSGAAVPPGPALHSRQPGAEVSAAPE